MFADLFLVANSDTVVFPGGKNRKGDDDCCGQTVGDALNEEACCGEDGRGNKPRGTATGGECDYLA